MVLILKGDGRDFQVFGLLKVLWKTLTGILNLCFTSVIQFHDVFHCFWANRGTGTTTLEKKLIQQLTSMREAVLYEIFMDLQKAYNNLERDRCLEILAAYGVGPRVIWFIWMYWGGLIMLARVEGYYALPFQVIPQCDTSIPPIPHDLQHGSGSHHPSLGDSGSENGGGRRGTRNINTGPCGVFLRRRWTRRVNSTEEAADGV